MKIVTSFSKGLVSAIAAVILLSVIIVSCTKENAVLEDSSSIAEKVSASKEFKALITTMADLNRTLNQNRVEKDINQAAIAAEAQAVDTKGEFNALLLKLGFNNASDVAQATENIQVAAAQVFKRFPQLYTLQQGEILSIFMQAKMIGTSSADALIKVERSDMCSDAYAQGKEACSTDLGWDLVQASVSGLFALAGGPLLSAGTILTLSGIAYTKEAFCNSGVVKAWRACRTAHPL